jgi:hypothetical protein
MENVFPMKCISNVFPMKWKMYFQWNVFPMYFQWNGKCISKKCIWKYLRSTVSKKKTDGENDHGAFYRAPKFDFLKILEKIFFWKFFFEIV